MASVSTQPRHLHSCVEVWRLGRLNYSSSMFTGLLIVVKVPKSENTPQQNVLFIHSLNVAISRDFFGFFLKIALTIFSPSATNCKIKLVPALPWFLLVSHLHHESLANSSAEVLSMLNPYPHPFNVCSHAVQCSEALHGLHLWGWGPLSWLSHGDGHLLRSLLCGFPFLLHQHLRGLDHHHLPGAGREWAHRPGSGQEPGQALTSPESIVAVVTCKLDSRVC